MIYGVLICLSLPPLQPDSLSFSTPAQKFEMAKEYQDSEDFEAAEELYSSISMNDTSYVQAISELMALYNSQKEYAKSIDIGNRVKDIPSDFRESIHINLGNAYLNAEEFELAGKVYLEGQELFPYSYILIYNLGICEYRQGRYKEAIELFQRGARINPYYSNNHIMLGYLSMLQGHRAKAMMSYLMYLAINPDSNGTLVFLERLVSDGVRDEGSIRSVKGNAFQELDEILRSKAAFDSRFKVQVDFDASIVKQTELLFSKLAFVDKTNDFWMEFYVPYYEELNRKGLAPAFIYFILKSTKNESVKSWLEKHTTEKSAWIEVVNSKLNSTRERMETEILGVEGSYSAWFFDNNSLSAIGNKSNDGTRFGPWAFYSLNSQLNAIGAYNERGEKIGSWRYFYDTGRLSRVEEYDENGFIVKPTHYYHENGALSIVANYKNNELNGTLDYYYGCGALKEVVPYKDGIRTGAGSIYFETGEKKLDYNMKNDSLSGSYIYYHKNGKVGDHYQYENGELNGPYWAFYADGSRYEVGQYLNGEPNGDWQGWHKNGKQRFSGGYLNGKREGKWMHYHKNGQLKEEANYANGDLQGEVFRYNEQGILTDKQSYKDGKIIGYISYNKKGEVLFEETNDSGNLTVISYYLTGEKNSEALVVGGKYNGPLTTYYQSGSVESKGSKTENEQEGTVKDYYSNGVLRTHSEFDQDEKHGFYRAYYINGEVEEEGWYFEGNLEQSWTSYFFNGDKKSEHYYIEGELNGWSHYYAPDNKRYKSLNYEKGVLIGFRQYDTLGAVYHEGVIPFGTGTLTYLTVKGDTIYQSHSTCGIRDQDVKHYHPGGKEESVYPIQNADYHGQYVAYWPNGQLRVSGQYVNGMQNGEWSWFSESGKLSTHSFFEKDERQKTLTEFYQNGLIETKCEYSDGSRSGPCEFFDQFGNLQLIKHYESGELSWSKDVKSGEKSEITRSGTFTLRSYFPNGKLAVEQQYLDGKFHGLCLYYNLDGSLSESFEWFHGNYHGLASNYFSNGKVFMQTPYQYDQKHGAEIEYYENGQIRRRTEFKFDAKNGFETRYSSSGKVISQTYFIQDEPY